MLELLDIDRRHAHLLVAGLEQASDRTVTAWGTPLRTGQNVRLI